jgi:hypothetical protein
MVSISMSLAMEGLLLALSEGWLLSSSNGNSSKHPTGEFAYSGSQFCQAVVVRARAL